MAYYNIPRPQSIAQPSYLGGAAPLAQGIAQGAQLASQMQNMELGRQQQAMNAMKMEQAQAEMSEAAARDALGSIAQGAETVLGIQGPNAEVTNNERYTFLANRRDQLARQGKNTEQTDEALTIGMNYGFNSPEFDQAMNEGIQTANSFNVFTPRQQMEREARAKAVAENTLNTKDKNAMRMKFRSELGTLGGKNLLDMKAQLGKITSSKVSGVGDVTMLKTINKMIDQGIVTSDDFDQIANSSGIADSFKGMISKITGGGQLAPEVRQQIQDQAKALYMENLKQVKNLADGVEQDAAGYGVSDVISKRYKDLFKDLEKEQPQANAYTSQSGVSFTVE